MNLPLVDRKPFLIGVLGTTGLVLLFLSVYYGARPQTAIAETSPQNRIRDVLPRGVLDDAGEQLSRIAAHVKTSVVHIESRRDGRSGGTIEETGSGIIMRSVRSPKLFVVTNRHVILGATPRRIQIKLHDGQIINPEQVVEDAPTDVAVLLLSESNLGSAAWGDSDNLDIGHMVLAMGSPFGLSQSVTLGIISAKGRRSLILGEKGSDVINQDFLQTDAAINPGNSGGPLIDLQGRVVGINTAIASQGGGNEGIGFSIPSNLCRHVVEQLLEHGRVQRAFLGVRLDEEFDMAAARRLRLNRLQGARVVEIYSDTPADAAGLQIDDVVLTFDGQDIEDQSHLIHLVSLTPINKVVRLTVQRAGSRVSVDVRLTERRATQTSQKEGPGPFKMNSFTDKKIHLNGFAVVQLNESLAVQAGITSGVRGVLVTRCDSSEIDDTLQLYDVIEEVARQPVHSPEELDSIIASTSGPVLFKVRRVIDGQSRSQLILWKSSSAPQSD